MICKKCGSDNINIQMVSKSKRQGKGFMYWFMFVWLIDLIFWLFLTIPRLLLSIVGAGKRNKIVNHKMHICQDCGYSWK